MPCRNVSWVAGLVCAFIMMLGPMGRTVDNMRNLTTVTPEMEEVLSEAWTPTSAPNMEMVSQFALKHYVRQSQSLSAGEKEIIQKRKPIILKSLNRLKIMATLDSVPHIALLGSGGGQRAAVSLLGSLYQMEKEDILDTVLYLGGVSGSAWSMISLYSDPQWSIDNIDRAVSRLSGPGVGLEEAFTWLTKRSKEEHFSLADIWGVMTAAGIMKQLNNQSLSEDGIKATNPYPIYNAVDKNCLQNGPEKGKWFEITPHEAGFTDLGFFINTSHLNSRRQEAGLKHKGSGMDNIWLQGVVGSAIADESRLQDNFPDWLKGVVGIATTDENNLLDLIFLWTEVPQQVKNSWDVLDFFKRGCHTLLKLIELIRKKTKDPAVLSDLDNLQKTLKEHLNLNAALFKKKSPKEKKLILEQWGQKMLEPLKKWSQSLDEGPVKENISWLTEKVFPLIGKWKWGTTNNFLYQYPDAVVPSCIRREKHLQLIDAGLMLNTPYPPFLGEKRDADLLIALDFASDLPFTTLILARDYAAKMKKPFPEIDDKILQEKDWPKDCYVFEGKDKQPTIVYMPLFNTRNCKDAEDFKAKMEEFATFQLPYNQEKIEFLLETAKSNIKNNKATLANEVYKATVRRYHKSLSRKSSAKPDH